MDYKQLVGVKVIKRNGNMRTVNLIVDSGYPSEIKRQIMNWVYNYEPDAIGWEWV